MNYLTPSPSFQSARHARSGQPPSAWRSWELVCVAVTLKARAPNSNLGSLQVPTGATFREALLNQRAIAIRIPNYY